LGKGNTGGAIAAPIFGEFIQDALGNTPPAPFRVPPGIKFVRVNLKTGLRAAANDPGSILEAFKPDEEPDDAYAMIGIANATADASAATASGGQQLAHPAAPPGNGRPEPNGGGGLAPNGMW
jgi:penicillin-binding protein 1A